MKRILLSFAHPDDEAFTVSLTSAKYSENGWEVYLSCATLGEEGMSGPYESVRGDALGAVRKTELRKSAEIIGIRDIRFLGYRDGTLKGLESGELESALYKQMVELSPSVVISFDTTGISNHPDHIKMCYATTYAFQKYAAERREIKTAVESVRAKKMITHSRKFIKDHNTALSNREFMASLEEAEEPRLYYACMPSSLAAHLTQKGLLPKESFGKPIEGAKDREVTAVINGSKYTKRKIGALLSHETQKEDVDRFLSYPQNPMLKEEYFILRMVGTIEYFTGKNDPVRNRL